MTIFGMNLSQAQPNVIEFADRYVIGDSVFDRNLNWIGFVDFSQALQGFFTTVTDTSGFRKVCPTAQLHTKLVKALYDAHGLDSFDPTVSAQGFGHGRRPMHNSAIFGREHHAMNYTFVLNDANQLSVKVNPFTYGKPCKVGIAAGRPVVAISGPGNVTYTDGAVISSTVVAGVLNKQGTVLERLSSTQMQLRNVETNVAETFSIDADYLNFTGYAYWGQAFRVEEYVGYNFFSTDNGYIGAHKIVGGVGKFDFFVNTGQPVYTKGTDGLLYVTVFPMSLSTSPTLTGGAPSLYNFDPTRSASATTGARFSKLRDLSWPGSGYHYALMDYDTNTAYFKRADSVVVAQWNAQTADWDIRDTYAGDFAQISLSEDFLCLLSRTRYVQFIPLTENLDVSLRWADTALTLENGVANTTLFVKATINNQAVIRNLNIELGGATFADGLNRKVITTDAAEVSVPVIVNNNGNVTARVVK